MKKILYIIPGILSLVALPAKAICPVCVVAVGAGLGLSKYLGIDDTISGLWIGGLTVALIAWTINWFNKKNWKFGNKIIRNILTAIIYYALIAWPLISGNLIGDPANTLWGLDKLILGIVTGSILFGLTSWWYIDLKKKNNNRAHFPFQKVIMPLVVLALFSLIFYFLTK